MQQLEVIDLNTIVCSPSKLAMKGSSYSGLLERHNIHTNNVEHIVKSLR